MFSSRTVSRAALLTCACLIPVSCKDRDESKTSKTDPNPTAAASTSGAVEKIPFASLPDKAATRFVELGAAETGIDFVNPIKEDHPLRYLYASAMSAGGAAIADVDGDGQQDVFLASGPLGNKLFRQTSRMKFKWGQ